MIEHAATAYRERNTFEMGVTVVRLDDEVQRSAAAAACGHGIPSATIADSILGIEFSKNGARRYGRAKSWSFARRAARSR